MIFSVPTALDQCRQALSLLEKNEDDPTNTGLRSSRAEALTNLGTVYVALATAPRVAGVESREYWRAARNMYQRSLEIWLDLRRRGILTGLDTSQPENVEKELAKCDAALSK